MTHDQPIPAIYVERSLTTDGTRIESRVHLDHLKNVLAARTGDGLLLRPAFQWAA